MTVSWEGEGQLRLKAVFKTEKIIFSKQLASFGGVRKIFLMKNCTGNTNIEK